MKEKVITFLHSEKIKAFNKRVFNKKTLTGAVIILVIAVGLKISFSLMFEVRGFVKKIDGSKVTVVNFINTRTIDVGDFPIASSGIKIGDRIEIMKNLSGEVINVRDENNREMGKEGGLYQNRRHNYKGHAEHNLIGGN